MKIFTIDQIRDADKFTIEHEPISSFMLMERAAKNIHLHITEMIDSESEINILCGPGNNGGDGLVIARLFANEGFKPTVWLAYNGMQPSDDNSKNLELINNIPEISIINLLDLSNFTIQEQNGVVLIDALFGSGLNRSLTGFYNELITKANQLNALKIAIDIPSGLFSDTLNHIEDTIFNANYTLTIEYPKLSFFYPENAPHLGQWDIIPIGLHPNYTHNTRSTNYYTTFDIVQPMLKSRAQTSHKGNFGHALMVTGSYGMIGASVLSAKSCLRSGVGLLTVHIPKCGFSILQSTVSEAMVSVDDCETHFTTINSKSLARFQSIGIGCGLGRDEETAKGLKEIIFTTKSPMVIDADAINILAENKTWVPYLPPFSVITPHFKEFERLVGKVSNSEQQLTSAKEFAIKNRIILVLKGANTAIVLPSGEIYFNSTGNPGMSTAGCGDVLTGIITGLLSQGYSPAESAILGVYIHGLAADMVIEHAQSVESLIASDIAAYLGASFQLLRRVN